MQLLEHRFEELSRLSYRLFTCPLGGGHNPTALILQFAGVYGIGSQGNGDAHFMRVVTRAALDAWPVDAAVFDLRKLDYQWGDAIWGVFNRRTFGLEVEDLPRALVVFGLCRVGFSTCQRLVPAMFEDLESALAFVAPQARANVDRLRAELDGGGEVTPPGAAPEPGQ